MWHAALQNILSRTGLLLASLSMLGTTAVEARLPTPSSQPLIRPSEPALRGIPTKWPSKLPRSPETPVSAPSPILQLRALPAISNYARLLSEGRAAQQSGDVTKALQIFNHLAKSDPKDPEPLYRMAEIAISHGDSKLAERLALEAIKRKDALAGPHTILGQIFLSNNEIDGAQKQFAQAVAITDSSVYAHRQLGIIHAIRGESLKSQHHFEKVLKYKDDDVSAKLNVSSYQAEQGQLKSALDKLAKGSTENSAIQLQMALIYIELGDNAKAIDALKRARELDPHDPQAFQLLATLSGASNDWSSAIEYADSFLQVDQKNANAQQLLAWCNYRAGNLYDAKEQFEDLVNKRPDNAVAHNLLSLVLMDLGRFRDAEIHLKLALEQEVDELPVQMNLIMMYSLTGKHDLATFESTELAESNDDAKVMSLAALVHEVAGKRKEAGEFCTKALKLNQDDQLGLIVSARLLVAEKKIPEALVLLERAQTAGGQDAFTSVELAKTEFAAANYQGSIAYAQQALQFAPTNNNAKRVLALSLGRQGNWEGASFYLKELVARNRGDTSLRFALAEALIGLNDLEGAEKQYREILTFESKSRTAMLELAKVLEKQHRQKEARTIYKLLETGKRFPSPTIPIVVRKKPSATAE